MNSVYPANTTSTSISIFRNRQMPERMDSYWLHVLHGYPPWVSWVWVTVRLEFEFGVFCGFYFSLHWQPPATTVVARFYCGFHRCPIVANCKMQRCVAVSLPFVSLLLDLPFLFLSISFLFFPARGSFCCAISKDQIVVRVGQLLLQYLGSPSPQRKERGYFLSREITTFLGGYSFCFLPLNLKLNCRAILDPIFMPKGSWPNWN